MLRGAVPRPSGEDGCMGFVREDRPQSSEFDDLSGGPSWSSLTFRATVLPVMDTFGDHRPIIRAEWRDGQAVAAE